MFQAGAGYKYVSKPESHQMDFNISTGRTLLSDLIEVGVIYNESFNPFQAVAVPILLMFALKRMCVGLSSTYLHFNSSNSISLAATITLRL